MVHGDLNPTNILLDNKNNIYINEFGFNKLGGKKNIEMP